MYVVASPAGQLLTLQYPIFNNFIIILYGCTGEEGKSWISPCSFQDKVLLDISCVGHQIFPPASTAAAATKSISVMAKHDTKGQGFIFASLHCNSEFLDAGMSCCHIAREKNSKRRNEVAVLALCCFFFFRNEWLVMGIL